MLRTRPRPPKAGFIVPCQPSLAERPPTGSEWIHEIKHDGYRLMARRDPVGVRLITKNGHDWSARYPRIVEAVKAPLMEAEYIEDMSFDRATFMPIVLEEAEFEGKA
jgi:ATP-dependent DNA ligase